MDNYREQSIDHARAADASSVRPFARMSNDFLTSITILGDGTQHFAVRAPESGGHEWLEAFPVCTALSAYHILHLGVVRARKPYRLIRTNPRTTQFLACHSGAGHVFVDGQWLAGTAGRTALFPPHTPIAYQAASGEPWELVWV